MVPSFRWEYHRNSCLNCSKVKRNLKSGVLHFKLLTQFVKCQVGMGTNLILHINLRDGAVASPPKHRHLCLLMFVLKRKVNKLRPLLSRRRLINTSGLIRLFNVHVIPLPILPHFSTKRNEDFIALLKNIKDVPWGCLAVHVWCLVLLFCLQFTCLQSRMNLSTASCTYC